MLSHSQRYPHSQLSLLQVINYYSYIINYSNNHSMLILSQSGIHEHIDQDVYFSLRGKIYINNSHLSHSEIGEGTDALLCRTNHLHCCRKTPQSSGGFYYPSGAAVQTLSHDSEHSFYHGRGDQQFNLNRREGVESHEIGRYRCEIPDLSGVLQSIFITLT